MAGIRPSRARFAGQTVTCRPGGANSRSAHPMPAAIGESEQSVRCSEGGAFRYPLTPSSVSLLSVKQALHTSHGSGRVHGNAGDALGRDVTWSKADEAGSARHHGTRVLWTGAWEVHQDRERGIPGRRSPTPMSRSHAERGVTRTKPALRLPSLKHRPE